ncbi:MAG: SGNH/GDSL hydrolase family protein [Paraclostridium sp.]|uniref:SGNH/GDSL hydrolase family protein n=1 Tax=Paraclostridium sp. TaxID=2023273 RepID=UPI003F2E2B73
MESKNRSIFVIGDSISIHYGPYLKEMIKDKFNYDRKRGIKEALNNLDRPIGTNVGDSVKVLEYLIEENHKNVKYDILLINCAMHDIRIDRNLLEKQVKESEYKMNLSKIIDIAKNMSSQVLWVSTTPFNEKIHNSRKVGFLRYIKDLETYNSIAKEIIIENNIGFIDLYSFTSNLGEDIYCDHVHFNEEVRKLQSAFIAGYLCNLKE